MSQDGLPSVFSSADLYLRVREKEGRLYSDDVVAHLPSVSNGHPLANEWRARAASASRLTRYLSAKPKPLCILDLGCGNGWLSNLLYISGQRVVGMDQNRYELKQAARIFPQSSGLFFLDANIFSAPFVSGYFDVIILASVIQYFHKLPDLLSVLMKYLKPSGEIHIMDSPLYADTELKEALQRSQHYYASLGFPEMGEHYFHHCVSDLKMFNAQNLYQPQALLPHLMRRLGRVDSPFPWYVIRKQGVE
ncbi:MAG: methyltransferase domain-containing protein [Chloroflexota bacterium]